MARSIARSSALCQLLPVAVSLALLLASVSHQALADSAAADASVSTNASGGGGSGGGGGILGAATGAITGGIAGAQAGAQAGSEQGANGGSSAHVSGSINAGGISGGASLSVGASGSSSSSGSSSEGSRSSFGDSSSSSASASASVSITTTAKPEGLLSKMRDMVKSGVDSLTHEDKKENSMAQSGSASQSSGSLGSGSEAGASAHVSSSGSGGSESRSGLMSKMKESAKEMKDNAREMKDDVKSMFKGDEDKSLGVSGGVKIGTANNNVQIGTGSGSSSSGNGGSSSSSDGSRSDSTISKLMHKVENKATEIGEKIKRPFQEEREQSRTSLPSSGSRSGLSGSSRSDNNERSLAVELLDKGHDVVKDIGEKALKPIDKALGVKEDPLVKMYDAGHEVLRHPLAVVSKPVESVLSGAFKTSEEAKKEAENSPNEMDRREVRVREEHMRKEGRSIFGEISDKSLELAEKPIEIILKPVDHLLGIDKDGKKNPLIQLINEIYGFSKKPVDAIAKPFENILRKMAEGEQAYQVSVRFNADSNDPKLFTRLADGALNIADRVITRPIEFAMRPLGFGQDRKNPIVDATHSLKNATRLGVELFTRPIDRIIKEIADIGAIKDESEREAEMERKRQEASRIVHALDKLHEISQTPWEIVLRPVGKVLGYNKDGKREPLLRAWDIVHQVLRTPIQVLSRPWEDAILGENKRQQNASKFKNRSESRSSLGQRSEERKKNFFTDQIRKVEKLAAKPLDVMTSPIRRLILGDDGKSSGSRATAKAQVGGVQAKVSTQTGSSNGPDKIVRTLEQMNNVVLKPFEVITQPISDILMSDEKGSQRKVDVKVQSSGGSASASASASSRSSAASAATYSGQQRGGSTSAAAGQVRSG